MRESQPDEQEQMHNIPKADKNGASRGFCPEKSFSDLKRERERRERVKRRQKGVRLGWR